MFVRQLQLRICFSVPASDAKDVLQKVVGEISSQRNDEVDDTLRHYAKISEGWNTILYQIFSYQRPFVS